jgi:hypothetical protein
MSPPLKVMVMVKKSYEHSGRAVDLGDNDDAKVILVIIIYFIEKIYYHHS